MSLGPSAYRIEADLAKNSPQKRRDRGVFYTPWQAARRIVSQIDVCLKREFGLADGLADTESWQTLCQRHQIELPGETDPTAPFVKLLEPAAGSGIFLIAALTQIYENIHCAERSQKEARHRWHKFAVEDLPGCLHAIEIMPEAIKQLQQLFSQFLVDHNIPPHDIVPISVHCGNALEPDVHHQMGSPATIVLGNPPFAAASTNTCDWIKQLLRGKTAEKETFRSYFEVDGNPLQEKKLWLHDDYVKFLRVSQWHLERAQFGVIGLVMNHGFLDNVTFRGLRYQLLDQFDVIEVLDLNGNSKKRGASSRLTRDESIFDIGQGVAISLFSKPPGKRKKTSVRFGEVWGPRESKLKEVAEAPWEELVNQEITPLPPHYFLSSRSFPASQSYSQGILVTDLFPRGTSTVVTARDALVIDTCRDRLLARIDEFRNPYVSDDQLRTKYFPRPRSSQYLPGDTRGWKLPIARQLLRDDTQWDQRIEPCAYRPFDRRWIYWSPIMIDWPRGEVMNVMRDTDTIGLVVRRQMPPDLPCNFFFVADCLAIDGLLRSDNRGNETLLPIAVDGMENINRDLLPRHLADVSARSLMAFVYALFHCVPYRTHFAAHLQVEFPRIFFPIEIETFRQLSSLGANLISLHLDGATTLTDKPGSSLSAVAAGYPKYKDDQIWIAKDSPLITANANDWLFHIGSHQVLRKWLKDRRGMILTNREIAQFRFVISAIQQTRDLMRQIDERIEKLGGLHRALDIS